MAEGPAAASHVQPPGSSNVRGARFVMLPTTQALNPVSKCRLLPLERVGGRGGEEGGLSHGKSLDETRGFQDFPARGGKGSCFSSHNRCQVLESPTPSPCLRRAPSPSLKRPQWRSRGLRGLPPAVLEVTPDMSAPFPLRGDKTHTQKDPGPTTVAPWLVVSTN